MSSTKTKENIIDILATHLTEKIKEKSLSHKFLVTSKEKYPLETIQGVCRKQFDLETKFDEADYITHQQVKEAFKNGKKSCKVLTAIPHLSA